MHYLFIEGELNGGGAERVLLDILRNFDYKCNQVDLLQITGGGVLIDEVPKEVNIIEAWHGYPLAYRLSLRCSLWFGWSWLLRSKIKKVLDVNHYDVAISFLEGMPLKMHAMITSVADRNYSWVHCDLDKDRYEVGQFRNGEEIGAYNKMDGVICVAADTALAFQRRFADCTSKVKVIYNPIDVSKILTLSEAELISPSDDAVFTIAVCGRLTAPKKLDRVIRLAKRIKDEGLSVKIQLIGDGNLRNDLEEQSEELGVTSVVEFMGFQRNPYPYIAAADTLLSTSGYEGFSLVICEAMALGVPVVATKTAGPMEILDNDNYGILCNHDDESIFQAVKKMYENEALRTYYKQVGKKRVLYFSVERTMSKIYQL